MTRNKEPRTGTPRSTTPEASIGHLRALAHPLRLRMLEIFAEAPHTTKQVAELLGEPPTRLYHHANALERAGLLRLCQTRPNRGATEKWYETPKQILSTKTKLRSGPRQAAVTSLANVALEQTQREVELALANPVGERPMVVRLTATGNAKRIAAIRKRIHSLIEELRRERLRAGKTGAIVSQRWTLTITFAPVATPTKNPRR